MGYLHEERFGGNGNGVENKGEEWGETVGGDDSETGLVMI